jgi:hypothetical protein
MYQVRPRGYDPFTYDPYGYWGAVDTTSPIIILALTKGVVFLYKEDRNFDFSFDELREKEFKEDRIIDFIWEEERFRLFEYKEDRIFDFTACEGKDTMSRVFYTDKQPNEAITCNIDFDDALSASEMITDVDATAFNELGEDCWSTIGGGTSVATDGRSISVGIIAGTAGYQYHINLACTLNTILPDNVNHDIIEADLYVSVKEL